MSHGHAHPHGAPPHAEAVPPPEDLRQVQKLADYLLNAVPGLDAMLITPFRQQRVRSFRGA